MDAPATFVMPHYSDHPRYSAHLDRALAGLFAQTDRNWQLVIIDDASPLQADRDRLLQLQYEHPGQINVLLLPVNHGPGYARNVGIRWAQERGSPIIHFHDSDDISHPRRVEVVRTILESQNNIDFVYSSFKVIDEHDHVMQVHEINPLVAETLHSHITNPVTGSNAWIRIATETGYTTQTSAVSVLTTLAITYPFPEARVSEDSHTWMRMSAGGSAFAFTPDIPSLYRLPRSSVGSSTRSRVGDTYFRQKIQMDTEGFLLALSIALERGGITPEEAPAIKAKFYRRLAESMEKERQYDLANALIEQARFVEETNY